MPRLSLALLLLPLAAPTAAEDNRARTETVVDEWLAEARQAVPTVETGQLKAKEQRPPLRQAPHPFFR